MNNAVQIVTIKNKIPLFKGEEKAERIELIQLEENGFELVSQKDLYQIGDKAVYIQPDFCLSDILYLKDLLDLMEMKVNQCLESRWITKKN